MAKSHSLESKEKYTFNKKNRKYIFHTDKKFGKNFVFTSEVIDTIIKLYSKFDDSPMTMGEISKKLDIPKNVIKFILSALNITHDDIPFSYEKVADKDVEELVEEAMGHKRFSVLQKFEKQDWKETELDAEKWRLFEHQHVNPFESFLENWTPPKYIPSKTNVTKYKGNKELIIGATDWHYGLVANERYLYNQKEWNLESTKKVVAQYAQKLKSHITEKNCYKAVKLWFGGDLIHTLNGFTDKGTKLEAGPLGEELLTQAFDSVVLFVQELLSVHNDITVYACSGNHSALGDYVLVKMLSLYFKNDKRIKFNITNKRFLTFKIMDNLFLVEHGYSSVSKDRLPAPGKGRETYINNLFMSKPDEMSSAKHLYYLSADQHHSESYEYTNVEGFMFPTLLGGCRHADNSGYKSRQRQTCLVVDKDGVSEQLFFFLD